MRNLWLFAVSLLFAASVAAKPVLTFEDDAVVARVSRGAKTAWFVVIHQWDGTIRTIHNGAFLLSDDDGDGILRYPLRGMPAAPGFWMVVDLNDGTHIVDAPKSWSPRRHPLPPEAYEARDNRGHGRLKREETFTTFFVARPGVGAWIAKVRDGAPADADGAADGNVMARIDAMTPVGDSPAPPDDLQRDDVVAMADLYTLTIHDGRVTK